MQFDQAKSQNPKVLKSTIGGKKEKNKSKHQKTKVTLGVSKSKLLVKNKRPGVHEAFTTF